jgi:uncharacterized protein
MKKVLSFLIIFIILVLGSAFSVTATDYTPTYTNVYDMADLLSDSEEISLSSLAKQYEEKYFVNVVFLTYNDAKGKDVLTYTDDFYDNIHYNENGVLFALDMDNREMCINTVGTCINALTDAERNYVLDLTEDYVFNKEYYNFFSSTCERTFEKMVVNGQISSQNNSDYTSYSSDWWIPDTPSIVATIVITLVFCIILIKRHNKANVAISATNYASNYRVLNRNERFIRTYQTVSHGYYKSSSSSGGGSSSRRSSGGVRHGGGSRKF